MVIQVTARPITIHLTIGLPLSFRTGARAGKNIIRMDMMGDGMGIAPVGMGDEKTVARTISLDNHNLREDVG